jgi:hypothetical protein
MRNPPRLEDEEATRIPARLLADAVATLERPWSPEARGATLRALAARLEAKRPARRWLPALGIAGLLLCVAGAVGLRALRAPPQRAARPGERVVVLGGEARMELSFDAEVEFPAAQKSNPGRRVVLGRGRLCAEVAHRELPREGPFVVEAPRLRVVVIGTQFCVASDGALSTVSVNQGRIRAFGPAGKSLDVSQGETLRSDDPRWFESNAPTLLSGLPSRAVRPATPACDGSHSVSARRQCYARVALGNDLASENALYGLGLLERDEAHDGAAALAVFRAYSQRFPQGLFSPEASLGRLGELLNEQRYQDAFDESGYYLSIGEDGGKPRVELVRAQLLLESLHQPAKALPLFRQLDSSSQPSVREEALFGLAKCLLETGAGPEAVDALKRYLLEFPGAKHAVEARSFIR